MRAGLRLRILVLLGALLVASFLPLYLAVAGYTTVAFRQSRERHARSLGRVVAAYIVEAQSRRAPADLHALLGAQIGTDGVEAIGVYGTDGQLRASAGSIAALERLGRVMPNREGSYELGGKLGVVIPAADGAVAAVLSIDEPATPARPLLRLIALYTALVALAWLLLANFGLTRLIVRPLEALTRAAERVAQGARRFTRPATNVRELRELGESLGTMTERLLAEEEALRKKIDEVELVAARLRDTQQHLVRSERSASVGRLAAGLAHEIGNPISALMGLTDLLLEGGLEPEEQRDFLRRMRRETERIHRILGDLLQFARQKPKALREEPGDVRAAVNDTVSLIAPQKAMKDVELRLELDAELPPVTLGSEPLVQIVLNLLLNAADAVSAGGHITLRARKKPKGVELSVEDDGAGVAEHVKEQIFEPFVTTKEVGHGTGLGLAVCRGLVEAVGGSITLDDAHRPGARFVVWLPAA